MIGPQDHWLSCTGGGNELGNPCSAGSCGGCSAGSGASMEIKCISGRILNYRIYPEFSFFTLWISSFRKIKEGEFQLTFCLSLPYFYTYPVTETDSKECPEGYESKTGDVGGNGQIGSFTQVLAIMDCSNHCRDTDNCCSFEYSFTEFKCNLNSDCEPNVQEQHKDYYFCSNSDEGMIWR